MSTTAAKMYLIYFDLFWKRYYFEKHEMSLEQSKIISSLSAVLNELLILFGFE